MKKSTLLMIVSVVLAMTLSLGGTLAYLSDVDSDVNVMTLGSVYIEQYEQERDGKGGLQDYPDYPETKPLYPAIKELEKTGTVTVGGTKYSMWDNNNVLDKIVTVENTGKSPAYVRTIFAVEDYVVNGENANLKLHWSEDAEWGAVTKIVALDGTVIEGATYDIYVVYYNGELASKTTSAPSLLQVALDCKAGNKDIEAYGDELNILVLSQAVQTEGFANAMEALNEGFGEVEKEIANWFNGTVPPITQDNADTDWFDPANKLTKYTINNAQELAGLSQLVWEGESFAGVTFELTADINLYGAEWQPIGRMINTSDAGENNTFKGNFDGMGHTVSNFTVDTVDKNTDTNRGAGLFGAVRGNIKNLSVENVTINTNHWAGAIAGCVEGNVTNCHVKNATITCLPEYIDNKWDNGDKAGAIVGYQSVGSAGVSGCSAENVTITAYRDMGALVGASDRAVANNTVSDVTLIQDNTHDDGHDINVNKYVGRLTAGGSDSNNTGDVTIVRSIPVSTNEELEAAVRATSDVVSISLNEDVALNVSDAYIKLGGENTKEIIINGNGKKLTLSTTYWSRLNTVNPDATIILNDVFLTSSQASGTWNSYDVTFQCNVEMNSVTLKKALALDGEGKKAVLNDVIINESHDYYALWISAAGQNVEIDGLTINSAGRGIKIDDQYVDAPAKVTLKVTDAKFNTKSKAAIMVKSAEGAVIALNNVSISGVVADTTNVVWVDADAAASYNLVNVTGGTKAQE